MYNKDLIDIYLKYMYIFLYKKKYWKGFISTAQILRKMSSHIIGAGSF